VVFCTDSSQDPDGHRSYSSIFEAQTEILGSAKEILGAPICVFIQPDGYGCEVTVDPGMCQDDVTPPMLYSHHGQEQIHLLLSGLR